MPRIKGACTRRVLLAVERCPQVLAWTEAARTGKRYSAEDARPLFPKDVEPDHSYSPIPCGRGSAGASSFALAAPHQSERFAVRGYIDAVDTAEIPHEIDGARVFSDPPVSQYRVCAESDHVGSTKEVRSKLNFDALRENGLDGSGVAIAIVDSGIYLPRLTELLGAEFSFSVEDSWKPDNLALGPGRYPVDHGTMCAFAALIAAPKATLLDYPMLLARGMDEHGAQATVSAAAQAYQRLQEMWRTNLEQRKPKYHALVVNNSWGIFHRGLDFPAGHPGRYIDNPEHPFHATVAALAAANVDILFAAGNCGPACPDNRCAGQTTETIMGANAYTEVLTIAGCDISDTRVEYSSRGPSIAGMPQEKKPDVTSYTHFRGSEIFGADTPDGGTSTACAVAAGCVAAVRTKILPAQTPPDALFTRLRNTARRDAKDAKEPWNPDYGYGIMNPWEAVKDLV